MKAIQSNRKFVIWTETANFVSVNANCNNIAAHVDKFVCETRRQNMQQVGRGSTQQALTLLFKSYNNFLHNFDGTWSSESAIEAERAYLFCLVLTQHPHAMLLCSVSVQHTCTVLLYLGPATRERCCPPPQSRRCSLPGCRRGCRRGRWRRNREDSRCVWTFYDKRRKTLMKNLAHKRVVRTAFNDKPQTIDSAWHLFAVTKATISSASYCCHNWVFSQRSFADKRFGKSPI